MDTTLATTGTLDSAFLDALFRDALIGLCFLDGGLRYPRINQCLAKINGISAMAHMARMARHASAIVPPRIKTI